MLIIAAADLTTALTAKEAAVQLSGKKPLPSSVAVKVTADAAAIITNNDGLIGWEESVSECL